MLSQLGRRPPDESARVLAYRRPAPRQHRHGARGRQEHAERDGTFAVTCTPEQPGPPVVRGNCLEANNTAQQALRTWLNAEGIAVDITEDVTQLGWNQYRAVIFMSPTRDTMWKHGSMLLTTNTNLTNNTHLDAAKTALRQYMRAGGGFVGIHNVFGTEYNWPYYEGLVGNANYYDHGANQRGTAYLTGSPDPSTQGLPADFETIDELYNMQPYPTNVKYRVQARRDIARDSGATPTPATATSTRGRGARTTTAAMFG